MRPAMTGGGRLGGSGDSLGRAAPARQSAATEGAGLARAAAVAFEYEAVPTAPFRPLLRRAS